MKIKRTQMIKIVTVDTDIGDFRVREDGGIEIWDERRYDYRPVTEEEFSIDDIFAIRLAANVSAGT